MTANSFSEKWYSTFLDTLPSEDAVAQVEFIERLLPPSEFRRLLDLGCGPGRYASHLVQRGYEIVGIDNNAKAIEKARANVSEQAQFRVLDMRDVQRIGLTFDGVLCLWQSFGYFDDETNRDVLRSLAEILRPGGRMLFDLYNREHFQTLPAAETARSAGIEILTRRMWKGRRLKVEVAYSTGGGDSFEWRLYTPSEFIRICESLGLHCMRACAWFDEGRRPTANDGRMQILVARPR